ncbi:hypothetical protein ZWY2020_035320 [Hordeum vulgare]|nr:hypothetical protein ZWY2020_035320 [Hordeum vulgare]
MGRQPLHESRRSPLLTHSRGWAYRPDITIGVHGDTYDPRPDEEGDAQRRVDRGRAHRDGHDMDRPSGSRTTVSGLECFSRAIHSADIPPNFRLATGISKFTGESKPETWLDDYRVAVQIGGGDDHVAMKHLLSMLGGSGVAESLAPQASTKQICQSVHQDLQGRASTSQPRGAQTLRPYVMSLA